MFDIVSKVQKSFFGKDESLAATPFKFLKDRNGILKTLTESLASGKLVGVYSRALGEGMFLTGVANVEGEGKTKVITFETYDLSGQILNRTSVSLDEIKMVCPFEVQYINPLIGTTKSNKSESPVLLNLW